MYRKKNRSAYGHEPVLTEKAHDETIFLTGAGPIPAYISPPYIRVNETLKEKNALDQNLKGDLSGKTLLTL